VLEPLSGYLWLAACLREASVQEEVLRDSPAQWNPQAERVKGLCGAFNFGPALSSNRTVLDLVRQILKHWPGSWEDKSDPTAVHEAKLLNLATDKAYHFLGWGPVWNFEETLSKTIAWYSQGLANPAVIPALTLQHITDYTAAANVAGLQWITPRVWQECPA
jgi:CDP-glucose 4,6-dehydratase